MQTLEQLAKLANLECHTDRLMLADRYEEEGDIDTAELLRDVHVCVILWDDGDVVENPFPHVGDLARDLARYAGRWGDGDVEIRLQIQKNGYWLWTGDPSYDSDHNGYWGSAILTDEEDQTETARDLIEQALDQFYQSR